MVAKVKSTNQAVAEVLRDKGMGDGIVTLSTGVRARLKRVPARLLDEVTFNLKDPDPPIWHNTEYDRDEENLADPTYLKGLRENARKRVLAQADALTAFGVVLVDGLPPDEEWLPQIRFLCKTIGQDLLAGVDLKNPLEKEFIYKKYVALTSADYEKLSQLAGITQAEVEAATASFPGNETRDAD